MIIDNGGSDGGFKAKVGVDGKLAVRGVEESEALDANKAGEAYNINTGIISLTDAVETPVLYFKNNEANDFIIEAVVIAIWDSAAGDGADMVATFIRNPTAGTIVTSENNVSIVSNRNYGSSNSLTADAYVGATGSTMTDGDDHILVRVTESSRNFIAINEVLPKGTSFGVKLTPPTSNNAMNCYVAIVGYVQQ